MWPDHPNIKGESARAGKPPKYVGIIAFMGGALRPGLDDLYVCLVVRESGLESFPKDITKRKKSLLITALKM